MIRSMTAFARESDEYNWGIATWEIRSVNHRYLEPSIKLSESDRILEPLIRDRISQHISRGKIECSLRVNFNQSVAKETYIDHALLRQVVYHCEAVATQLKRYTAPNPLEVLRWPGIMQERIRDVDEQMEQKMALFQLTLEELMHSRNREGIALQEAIEMRIETIESIVKAISKQLPDIVTTQQQRLRDRLGELYSEIDQGRLEQEIVLLAQKSDVAEEIDRIKAHVFEVRRIINQGGACGRRLDFLMQELNREANTLSAKSISNETTSAAIELRVMIEQMREQIQNVE